MPDILGDANQLQQVFLNLILNAAAAMPHGGKLEMSPRVEEPRGRDYRGGHGCGIREENLDRIFDPFFTTKPVGQGTGLGLSVRYGIIEQHGGTIEVESELDRDSASRFGCRSEPATGIACGILEEERGVMSMATATQQNSLPPQRILVIDDETMIGMGIRRVFEPDGHEVRPV